MILRPSLLRALADYTREAVNAANGAPVHLTQTTHDALRAAGRNPDGLDPNLRAATCDVVEACIYALGGEVQS